MKVILPMLTQEQQQFALLKVLERIFECRIKLDRGAVTYGLILIFYLNGLITSR